MKRPVALVTGGTKRVGRAIALALARRGCDIVVTSRSPDGIGIEGELKAIGVNARVARFDPVQTGSIPEFAEDLRLKLHRLDVLVHNASAYAPTPIGSLSEAGLLEFMRINAIAPALLTAALAGLLSESALPGGGSVVAMCDIHALGLPRRNHVAYAMSKAALAELVRSMARDLAPRVRVNGVAPGVVAWPETGPEAEVSFRARYLSRVPLARAGEPDDAAGAVAWLALDAPYITGQIIRVDGGRSLV